MLETPILFLIFNRPETTQQVFNVIRKAKPKQLFVAADGPRKDKTGEKEKCEVVRKIATAVDWDCEVRTLFRDSNLGCGIAVSEGITWFFENVEQGIILEDDCLPDESFFYFSEILLNKYKNEPRIWHIGGSSFYDKELGDSYFFSAYPFIWGWATWKRAWKHYDFFLTNIDRETIHSRINDYFLTNAERKFWKKHFSRIISNNKNYWDYQWTTTIWYHNGLSILPQKNLVTNIGFGENATHTKDENSPLKNYISPLNIENFSFQTKIFQNKKADLYASKKVFFVTTQFQHLINQFKGILKKAVSKLCM